MVDPERNAELLGLDLIGFRFRNTIIEKCCLPRLSLCGEANVPGRDVR